MRYLHYILALSGIFVITFLVSSALPILAFGASTPIIRPPDESRIGRVNIGTASGRTAVETICEEVSLRIGRVQLPVCDTPES